ncbi:MAG: hypothetical protein LUG52_03905, partial [Clostridia bacterium]|nr:hypothetical protein [Clostridia bacterium]
SNINPINQRWVFMERIRKYIIEEDEYELYVPIFRDQFSGRILEDYREWLNLDRFTPSGHLILVSSERSCEDAESTTEEKCTECAACRFYKRAAPNTWIGICTNEKLLFLARDGEDDTPYPD